MTETSRYLSVLAKVMRSKNLPNERTNKEKYDRLYYLIHSDLNSKLQKSMYPHTSDIIRRAEDMLDAIEPLYLCPEVIAKKCLWVSCHITTNIFDICKSLFVNQEFIASLKKIYTQIPFVIVNADEGDLVEIVNFANIRITLSINELKFLIIESGRRKIALNKIIQFVIINTKLCDSMLCILSDNIYYNVEKLFARVISGRLIYIDEEGVKTVERRRITKNSSILLNENILTKIEDNFRINKHRKVLFSDVDEYVNKDIKPVLYGFWEEFASIEIQILDYYDNQLVQAKETLQEVVGDIIRLEDSGDRTLQLIRSTEESREKKLKLERKNIASTLKNIDELITDMCADLGEIVITEKRISRKIFDDIFSAFFMCKGYSSGLGKKLLSRLYSYEYDNYDLVTAYVQSNSKTGSKYEQIDIDLIEWEKAKMLIDILEPENIHDTKLKLYIKVLGEHCCTGKELFAKALTLPEKQRQEILQQSLLKGYEKAGDRLLEMFKQKRQGVNLQTLANALVPEACMILADQNIKKYQNRKRFADLTDREFTFYKIAAANQYSPAIGKIVDVVFESRFALGFQIPKKEIRSGKYDEMIENGHVICKLCNFLIGKMYQAEHYSEIRGIVLFCLNEDLSEAMSLLSNSKSALGLYCKGNMYEFGGGVAIDLDQAIKNYSLSLKKEYLQRTEKRLEACQGKKSKAEQEKSSSDYYQSSKTYKSSTTYTGSSAVNDGCFAPQTMILMSDGSFRKAEDIKINDNVVVFDHYTGKISSDRIVANVHNGATEIETDLIILFFEDDVKLRIVKSHALFDVSQNQYVWIDSQNVANYVGDKFACYFDGKIVRNKLINYLIHTTCTKYYMPISRYHLNIFAEGLLTIPPTKMTVNLFRCGEGMQYDMEPVWKYGITEYKEIQHLVSYEEYVNLPCKYLKAVCINKKLFLEDFTCAIELFRDQEKQRGTASGNAI